MTNECGTCYDQGYVFFEIPELGLYEPAYHEQPILEQLKAEKWGWA